MKVSGGDQQSIAVKIINSMTIRVHSDVDIYQ